MVESGIICKKALLQHYQSLGDSFYCLFDVLSFPPFSLYRRNISDSEFSIISTDKSNNTKQAISSKSDLMPGVYEGGLKTWECSLDLAKYLVSIADMVKDKAIFEVGCGSGIPGIVAAKLGCKSVDFQDFNKEVVENVTFCNLSANLCKQVSEEELATLHNSMIDLELNFSHLQSSKVDFSLFYGDWNSLLHIIPTLRYDLILTSETIYCPSNYAALIQLFDSSLSLNAEAMILVAAKKFYFGLDGSILTFKQFIEADGRFEWKTCWSMESGVSREIISLSRSQSFQK